MSIREPDSSQPAEDDRGLVARGLAGFASVVWWAILVVLVLFALYVGVGRQLTASLDRFSDELAGELSAATGLDVSVGSLSSQWYWLDPSITAKDITVRSPDSGRLEAELEHLALRLDFFASLFRFRLVFRNFDADGLALTVVRPTEDPFTNPVEEIVELAEPGPPELQHWLRVAGRWLSNPEVRVTRVSLGLGPSRQNLRFVDIPQLDLSYRGGLFQAAGRAMQSGTTTELARFALVGQGFFRGEFTGQLYLDVGSGRFFDGLIDDLQWRGIRVEGFDLGGSGWLTFAGGDLEQIQGQVSTPYLQLGVNQASLAPLENIEARFGWRRGEALNLQELRWDWIGDPVSPFSIRIGDRDGDLTLVADSLPLQPLRRLVEALRLLPKEANEALVHYQPTGFLDDMLFVLPEQGALFSLSARLRDVGVSAWSGAPGARGLDGHIQMDAVSGRVVLNTREPAILGFPELFNTEWTLDSLSGTVAWNLSGGITRVHSEDLEFTYQADTRLSGAFDLRLDQFGEDNLGLRVGVEDGNASMLADFVPVHAVGGELYNWLTESISQARVRGRYYGHGRIDAEAPSGAFVSSMWYGFEDAAIRFDPGWPAVEQSQGRVVIQNSDTRVALASGQIGGLELKNTEVRVIPGKVDNPTRVDVAASTVVPGERVPWWLTNTPLGELLGYGDTEARYSGSFELDLGLDLPLAEGHEPRVTARLQTGNGGFELPGAGLSWQEIAADITYDSTDGFTGEPATARFFGQPVDIGLSVSDKGSGISVRQTGKLAIPASLTAFNVPEKAAPGLSGALHYSAELELGGRQNPVIELYSDLQGLQVDWPEPLAKASAEHAPLTVRVDPFESAGLSVSAQWQDRIDAHFLLQETGFELMFDSLNLGSHRLTDISVKALELDDRWIIHTESDRAKGRVLLPKSEGIVEADFETLRLVREPETAPRGRELLTLEEQLQAFRDLDMGNWPDIDVRIADLRLDGQSAGNWQFKLRPEPYQLNVQAMEGRLGSLVLSGDMTWSVIDKREATRFRGSLNGGALKDLEALTGTSIPMTNAETGVELDLDWPGGPDDIAPGKISGSVSIRLDDGMIMEQSNSAQLFRVFNLLNTDTLWRRLQLDFSDLYERGVAFDAISGKAQIINGLVTLDPELQLVGPSGAFKLSGTTNMTDESLDMRLVLVLPVTQNLPLAALLMGASAPIGGALFVLDKILGDPLSRLTSATYSVTGSWSEPEVDLRGVFDTGE
ncbi:YhdP family protein [Marinobacter sp. VGCF2001]|uniref:YhdP family phospholipid transporter n=1 Tax=Marinobacter sp. VGCF2001 TaxID=3417189 RepID=UPI003CF9CAAE